MKNRRARRARVEGVVSLKLLVGALALGAACGTPTTAEPRVPFGGGEDTDTTQNPATGEDGGVTAPGAPSGDADGGVVADPVNCAAAALEAQRILTTRCASCHGNGAANGGFSTVLDVDKLVSEGRVVPDDAEGSPLFRVVQAGAMPKGGPRLSSDELDALSTWIECGAPDPTDGAGDAGVPPADGDAGLPNDDDDDDEADDDDDDDDDDEADEDIDEAADQDEDLDEAQEEAAEGDDDD